jgi:hypothetical protein
MADRNERNDMNKALFANVVMMLASSAMQQLGKLVNPMTNKTEINLEGAQITIDMLAMLKDKTKGNLDKDEDKMLTELLTSLQLNYVETAESAPQKADQTATESSTANTAQAADAADGKDTSSPQDAGSPPKNQKDPKYHKTYG